MEHLERLEKRIDELEQGSLDNRLPLLSTNLDVEDAIFSSHTKYIVKTSDELINNNTLQDDNELLLPVGSFERWGFELFLHWKAPTNADIKFLITVPTGGTGFWMLSRQEGTSTSEPSYRGAANFSSSLEVQAPSVDDYGAHIFGAVLTDAASGDITLQWAQNATQAAPTTVFAHSWLKAVRID